MKFSQIIQEPEFQSLALDEQKQMVLSEMLDLNQMYVSCTSVLLCFAIFRLLK